MTSGHLHLLAPAAPTAAPPTRDWRRDLGAGLALLSAVLAGAGGALTVLAAATVLRSMQLSTAALAASTDPDSTAWAAALYASTGSGLALPIVIGVAALLVAALTAVAAFAVAAGRTRIPALTGQGLLALGLIAIAVQTQAWLVLLVAVVPLAGLVVLIADEAASGARAQRAAVPW